MHLTPSPGKATRVAADPARTTVPGYVNSNGQTVIAKTGTPSTSFPGQTIYELRCGSCGTAYGANGCDIHARRCPHCQEGVKGEPLRERPALLFD